LEYLISSSFVKSLRSQHPLIGQPSQFSKDGYTPIDSHAHVPLMQICQMTNAANISNDIFSAMIISFISSNAFSQARPRLLLPQQSAIAHAQQREFS
jgi:hypothetical protein